jgi:LuxR family maltose regulon positive regulatory protein
MTIALKPQPRETRMSNARPGGRLIQREALLERLHLARLGCVSLVQAPAGYGKTTLLTAWQATLVSQDTEVVWLAVDEELSAPSRFFSALRRLIGAAARRVAREALERQSAPAPHQARQLAASLSSRSEPLVIILDDYHRAATDELDAALGEFLRGLPPAVHVAVSSRPPVKVPTAVLGLEATLTRFELKDMRFSDTEIHELFEHELSSEELASISVWTEGWPIVVQLARSYLQDPLDRSRALARLSARADQDIGAYLTEQVLARLAESDRDLLATTSFLERLDPDLVEAVTDARDVWRTLERLSAACVLVGEAASDGDSATTYRCHHLLREALYAELRRRGRAEVQRLRSRAASWMRRRGQLEDALRQARAAADFDLVAQIILERGGILYGVRHGSPELRRLLDYLPPEQLNRQPRLRLAQCFELAKEGRMDAAREAIRAVRGRYQSAAEADPLLARDLELAEIAISAYSGTAGLRPAQLAALEKVIGDAAEDDILWRAILNNLMTAMHYQLSDFTRAHAAGEAALHNYAQASASNGLAHTHVHLGLIELELTHTAAAFEHFQSAKAYYGAGEGDGIGCAFADVLVAEALYEQGQLDEARGLCAAALPAMEEGEHLYPVFVSAYHTLSGIATLQDGLSAGLSVLAEAMRMVRRRRLPEVERMIDLRRAELQLQAGEFSQLHAESVEKVEASWDGSESGSARTWNETDRRMLLNARLALQDGDHQAAALEMFELDRRCLAGGRQRRRISCLLLLAAAHFGSGRRDLAINSMRQAISLSEASHIVRPFLEERRTAMPILVHLSASAETRGLDEAERAFVNRLIGELQSRSGPLGPALFSTRELEILQQLVLGNNNKLIARALGITPHTVRFHLKKIYEKLGVNDRKVVVSLTLQRGLLEGAHSSAGLSASSGAKSSFKPKSLGPTTASDSGRRRTDGAA